MKILMILPRRFERLDISTDTKGIKQVYVFEDNDIENLNKVRWANYISQINKSELSTDLRIKAYKLRTYLNIAKNTTDADMNRFQSVKKKYIYDEEALDRMAFIITKVTEHIEDHVIMDIDVYKPGMDPYELKF